MNFANHRLLVIEPPLSQFITSLAVIHPPVRAYVDPWTQTVFGEDGVESRHELHVAAEKGEVIMPKLGNATAKAELGRATWKLL